LSTGGSTRALCNPMARFTQLIYFRRVQVDAAVTEILAGLQKQQVGAPCRGPPRGKARRLQRVWRGGGNMIYGRVSSTDLYLTSELLYGRIKKGFLSEPLYRRIKKGFLQNDSKTGVWLGCRAASHHRRGARAGGRGRGRAGERAAVLQGGGDRPRGAPLPPPPSLPY